MMEYISKVTHGVALDGRTPRNWGLGAPRGGKTAKTKTAPAGLNPRRQRRGPKSTKKAP
jgi:hypothetical protein